MSENSQTLEAVKYLKKHRVAGIVEGAIERLVAERPEHPKDWLRRCFGDELEERESDDAYLRRHNIREMIDKAVLDMVKVTNAEEPKAFLREYFTPVYTSPPRRQVEEANDDTPPTSPGNLVRGRSFLGSWTSQLQRYYLQTTSPMYTCNVHASRSTTSSIVTVKKEYDGIAVDKEEDGWLRITEGTGWVLKAKEGEFSWVPMGTEAGIVLRESEIPGGFGKNQPISSALDSSKHGVVLGKSETGTNKIQVKWDGIDDVEDVEISEVEIKVTRTRPRAPTMVWDNETTLIPPQAEEDKGLPVVVFDLDETLIYAREGPLHARAGVAEMFKMLHGKAEVLVWTAGMRAYAQAIIQQIDPLNVVKHCVYRHPKWHPIAASGQRKNLTFLGRPMEHILLVENSPDSLIGDEENAVLLPDYVGRDEDDNTIPVLFKLLKSLVNQHEITVPEFLHQSQFVV
eukprot:TRINITY_DN20231_c0_g1_i2.p1 TRINITY_DN20231_c0_g1~~TRINITY_DN20231_c0_g1_i2.p1  ORF type:complete len:456 (+),score=92.66 TRINITY_DN20231_c0_g1_i2:78-1445(+)